MRPSPKSLDGADDKPETKVCVSYEALQIGFPREPTSMRGLRINIRGNDRFDLGDILEIVGERVLGSEWRCRDLYYLVRDEESGDFEEAPRRVPGAELLRFADAVTQVIDGRFEATSPGAAKKPWLLITAVDSSYWEVWSTKHDILESVRSRFVGVMDLPPTERP